MEDLLHPDLQAVVDAAGLDAAEMHVGYTRPAPGVRPPRSPIPLVSEQAVGEWHVPSLRALFRGNGVPPSMAQYPEEYVPAFYLIERHLLQWADTVRAPTDHEVEEAFNNLRRRPDGRSFGDVHDALWQAAAFTLGIYALSAAEFEALVGRLAKSARGWSSGTVSRGYVGYLRESLLGGG